MPTSACALPKRCDPPLHETKRANKHAAQTEMDNKSSDRQVDVSQNMPPDKNTRCTKTRKDFEPLPQFSDCGTYRDHPWLIPCENRKIPTGGHYQNSTEKTSAVPPTTTQLMPCDGKASNADPSTAQQRQETKKLEMVTRKGPCTKIRLGGLNKTWCLCDWFSSTSQDNRCKLDTTDEPTAKTGVVACLQASKLHRLLSAALLKRPNFLWQRRCAPNATPPPYATSIDERSSLAKNIRFS